MNPEAILGIDPSTKRLALVTHDEALLLDLTRWKGRKLAKYGPESASLAYEGVARFLGQCRTVQEVWLEAPAAMKAGIDSTLKQGYISGAVQAAVATMGRTIYLVPPATWKANVCSHGNASKEDVARVVQAQWPEMWPKLSESQDLIDAAALYLHGVRVERRRVA